jgi:hypothetical protein
MFSGDLQQRCSLALFRLKSAYAQRTGRKASAKTNMKIETWMPVVVGSCAFVAGTAWGADAGVSYNNVPRSEQVFRADEFSIDAFGTLALGEDVIEHISRDRVRDNGRFGFGAGANYFFTRYFGISGEAYTENTGHSLVDDAGGSLVVRFPFDPVRLAPYIFGGGGYQFDPIEQPFAHAGGGLEYRFKNNMGIFVDGRYVFTRDSRDFGLGRLGFRFSF